MEKHDTVRGHPIVVAISRACSRTHLLFEACRIKRTRPQKMLRIWHVAGIATLGSKIGVGCRIGLRDAARQAH